MNLMIIEYVLYCIVLLGLNQLRLTFGLVTNSRQKLTKKLTKH